MSLSSILNGMSLVEKNSLKPNKTFLTIYGPETNIGYGLNFNDIKLLNPAYVGVAKVCVF
jgi:hypothetical protein